MAAHSRTFPRSLAWIGGAVAGIGLAVGLAAVVNQPRNSLASPPVSPTPADAVAAPSPQEPLTLPSPPPPQPVTFTAVFAGDVLTHTPVLASAQTPDGYDFTPLLAPIEDFITGADLAICHLEVPVVPQGRAPSGYPVFGAPQELVRDLEAVGWDGCSTASNHSLDRAFPGVEATLDAFDTYQLGAAGTARTEAESTKAQFYNVQVGTRMVKVANISFSYGTNGLPLPEGKPWSVNLFDADAADAQPIIDAAQAARAAGADIVIASTHCCVEYQTEPSSAQREVAQLIAESGAVDLYVGHHAHVPQPIELLPGGPQGDGMWTLFGLGNFVSNQDQNCCVPQTSNGVLATATFTVQPNGETAVGVEWTATTVDRFGGHTVYSLSRIQDGAGKISAAEAALRYEYVREAVGPQATERVQPPVPAVTGVYPVARG